MQVGWPGPKLLATLQPPSTASSGRSDTCRISGFTYGFFVDGADRRPARGVLVFMFSMGLSLSLWRPGLPRQ